MPLLCSTPVRMENPVMVPRTDNLRVVLYSHDTMGLGHVRRNLLIAQALTRSGMNATALLISGIREAGMFAIPDGVDLLCLPSVRKTAHEKYTTRQLQMPLDSVTSLRSQIIRASIQGFDPDLLIVDKVPRGLNNELAATLAELRRQGKTRCVLGLRDVMDEPDIALAEWHGNGNEQFVRDHFDAIWIYGDKSVYDTAQACRIADDLRQRACFTGYLDQRPRLQLWECGDTAVPVCRLMGTQPFVLGVVGGGQDGEALALAFANSRFPEGRAGVLVTGPYLPPTVAQQLRSAANRRNDLTVVDFCPEVDVLLSRAERVVSMGGYNSICSILSYDKPALVVPRVWPRREQHLRAARMEELGLFDVLHPSNLSADAISNWFHKSHGSVNASSRINLDGLQSIQSYLLQHFSQSLTSRTIAC